MKKAYIHPTALAESREIGAGTRVWAFTHILPGARVGQDCNIGDHCFIESGAVVGDNVTLKNGNMVWEGVRLADGVFVGPNVFFTNDRHPRSPRLPQARQRYTDETKLAGADDHRARGGAGRRRHYSGRGERGGIRHGGRRSRGH